jgi:hypothetical protein
MITLQASYHFGAASDGRMLLGTGWAAPEADFVWSVGAASTLLVPAPQASGETVLEFRIEPFIAPPELRHQHASLTINHVGVGSRRVGGPLTWRVAVPADALAPGMLRIDLARAAGRPTPAELGLPDPRDLGFKLTNLKVLTRRPVRPPPPVRRRHALFRFGCNEPTAGLLQDGWGEPEDGFVWAVGRTSTLSLPLHDAPRPAVLLLDMRPVAAPSGARQRLAIGANGKLLGYLDLRARGILALPIDPARGADSLTLHFDNIDAYANPGLAAHVSGLPFAWALASARLAPAPARVAPASLPRLAGRWADATLADAVAARCGLSLQDLVTRFESIAGSCRLGNLQRRLDRDQVGLLRYAAVHQHELVEGILAGFADVGRPDALLWDVRGPEDTTWRLIDLVFQISFATPYKLAAPPPSDAIAKFGTSLPWLAAKLMEDVASADKIFLTRLAYDSDDAAALAVLTALRRFGDAWLLLIDDAGRAEPGSVERLANGLLRGHLDAREDADLDLADTSFVSLLANAWALAKKE